MNQTKLLAVLIGVLLFCTSLQASAQEDYRSGAIKTDYGYLLVWNATNNYYTIEIKGKNVSQTSTEQVQFSVDGVFLPGNGPNPYSNQSRLKLTMGRKSPRFALLVGNKLFTLEKSSWLLTLE